MSHVQRETDRLSFVRFAMRRPITIVVSAIVIALTAFFGLSRMQRDILPDLGVPIIYIAQPYGGMDPSQMEGYLTYYYESHFLYLPGVDHMESRNIQSTALMKLQFRPGTDMAEAMAQTINYVNRARAYLPPGTLPPFILRFDAGSEPVGDLVFSSSTRSLGELQDYALNYVRPVFATLPGVSSPAPFGASQRAIVVDVDPRKLRRYNLSPYDVAESISDANKIIASGNIHMGTLYPMVPVNSVVRDISELYDIPIRTGTYPTVFLKDVARVENGTDIQTGYALLNGKRTVYIPVTKRADASTLDVVNLVRENLPKFQAVVPSDIKVSYEFDQSGAVRQAIDSLLFEGVVGAILTALMVLLFLRDVASALVVVITIPIALLFSVGALWATGQTINIMTLGGLALAVGILVDETTIVVENIHSHLSSGKTVAQSALDATAELLMPGLLTVLCILAVFVPSFFMQGVSRALFIPLSLAVGFAVSGAFFLARGFVPVSSTWLLGRRPPRAMLHQEHAFERWKRLHGRLLERAMPHRRWVVAGYLVLAIAVAAAAGSRLGREIFPQTNQNDFRLRIRAAAGTSIDETEKITLRALDLIKREVGADRLESSVGYVGTQPGSFPVNAIYLWTSGPHEAVLNVALKPGSQLPLEPLKEKLRGVFSRELPEVAISFEPSGLINRIMSQGSPTPVQVAISGPDLETDRNFGEKLRQSLAGLPYLRDLQFDQVFEYPAIHVDVNRRVAGLLGLTIDKTGRAVTPATSSSRYVMRTYWADPKTGITQQIQVQVPSESIRSIADVRNIPISLNGGAVLLSKFADVHQGTVMGEYDRYNMQRTVSLTANLFGADLSRAERDITALVAKLESQRPPSVTVRLLGLIKPMHEMFESLKFGFGVAIIAIFLLLAANFESFSLSLVALSSLPAAIAGIALALWITATSLNMESFMGAIMAIGVAVANSIFLVTFAEQARGKGSSAARAAVDGAKHRLRPILMTSLAMIAGMVPMALGLTEGSEQTAPLGRAVIGGLAAATMATLFVVPLLYAQACRNSPLTRSLDPDDPKSRHFSKGALGAMLLALAAGIAAPLSAVAQERSATPLSLVQAIALAERNHPALRAREAEERGADAGIGVARSSYFPSLELGAVESAGFPGSGASSTGVLGMLASPYRSGPAIGAFSRLTVFDLTREYGLRESKLALASASDKTREARLQIDQQALQLYLEASRNRGRLEIWRAIHEQMKDVLRIVHRLVGNGQHSMVSEMLVQDQLDDAALKLAVFSEQHEQALKRLALVTGLEEGSFSVPSPSELPGDELAALKIKPGNQSPLIARAETEMALAKARVSTTSAQNLPKIVVDGGVARMAKTRLVPSADYAVAAGITFPLFEGFRIQSESQRARAYAEQKEQELVAARLALDDLDSRFDEIARAARLRVSALENERKNAQAALKMAKERYLSFRGLLVDVREALRNMARIEGDLVDARADLLLTSVSRAMTFGATFER